MPKYRPPPDFAHGNAPKTGILLTNLGTPDAPTPAAVRRYLKEFLSDERVVEIPRAAWWLILNGVILNLRPRASAKKYAMIWSEQGSPLLAHSERQARLLAGFLHKRGVDGFKVALGMRYGNPAIPVALDTLLAQGCDRILVLPLYPQYAAATTASTFDAVAGWSRGVRNLPGIDFVRGFHDHPGYIGALAASVLNHWEREGARPDVLVMSFHGLPRSTLSKGDPYHCECQKTARLLAQALGLEAAAWRVTFQSRFGKARWLQPYTAATLSELGAARTARVDVVCPGFVADCLETLEEIAMEGRDTFRQAGGGRFTYIPCLNARDDWLHALADIVMPHLAALGRPTPDSQALTDMRNRAVALGAAQ